MCAGFTIQSGRIIEFRVNAIGGISGIRGNKYISVIRSTVVGNILYLTIEKYVYRHFGTINKFGKFFGRLVGAEIRTPPNSGT